MSWFTSFSYIVCWIGMPLSPFFLHMIIRNAIHDDNATRGGGLPWCLLLGLTMLCLWDYIVTAL